MRYGERRHEGQLMTVSQPVSDISLLKNSIRSTLLRIANLNATLNLLC